MSLNLTQLFYCYCRYHIMLHCWEPNSKSRPSFEDLVHHVRQVIITLEMAHQQVGLDTTYINFPTQSYLYPRGNAEEEEPSPVVQNHLNNNNSHYHQQQVTQTVAVPMLPGSLPMLHTQGGSMLPDADTEISGSDTIRSLARSTRV